VTDDIDAKRRVLYEASEVLKEQAAKLRETADAMVPPGTWLCARCLGRIPEYRGPNEPQTGPRQCPLCGEYPCPIGSDDACRVAFAARPGVRSV